MSPTRTLTEPNDLTGFPESTPPPRIVRLCRAVHPTWWFSNDGSGRFDLSAPDGTCYFATDDYAAIREATRLGPVSTAWLQERELREVAAPEGVTRLAATTRKAAGRYGMTTELATVVPYDLPQRWATAFRAAGFDGIRHQLRHDQRARPSGIAIFGPAEAISYDEGGRVELTRKMIEEAGVTVMAPPASSGLTILE